MSSLDQNSYNKGGMIAFMSCMVVTILFFVYIAFFSGGIDLKEVSETQPEAAGVTQVVAKAEEPTVDPNTVKEPWTSSPELIASGHKLFSQNCQMCHGATGLGDGPAGASLNPKPRNMVEGKWKYGGGRMGIMKVLREGSPGTSMQSYKDALTVNQRWALTHFVNSITNNKVADNDTDVAKAAASLQ